MKLRFSQIGSLLLFLILSGYGYAAKIPLAVFGDHAFFYENNIRDMLTQDLDTTVFFQAGDPGSEPMVIRFLEGYLLEESQTLHLESGKHLITIIYRNPAKARYAHVDAYLVSQNQPYITELEIPEISQPFYQGTLTLGKSEHTHFLKIYAAVVSPFYGPPFVYEIHSFGLWDESLSLVSRTYSKPEEYTGYFNLAQHFMEAGDFQKGVTFSLLGMEQLKDAPDLLDDGLRSQVRLNLGKSYLGVRDYNRAWLVLTSIVQELPKTPEAVEAKKLLEKMK